MANGDLHVLPLGDLIEHEKSDECACGPDWQMESGVVIYVHHSLDGREQREVASG